MTFAEYARCDALGLAALVASGQLSPKQLALAAAAAVDAVNTAVNAGETGETDEVEIC